MNQNVQLSSAMRGATPTQSALALAHQERLARMVAPHPNRPAPRPRPAAGTLWFSIIDELNPGQAIQPSIRFIQDEVCAHFGVSRGDLLSERRQKFITTPRQVGMHLCRVMTRKSFPMIGRLFGGRDHTTVLHASRKMMRLAVTDPDIRADIDSLVAKITKRWGAQ